MNKSDIFTSEMISYQFTSEWYDLYFHCSENKTFLAQILAERFEKQYACQKGHFQYISHIESKYLLKSDKVGTNRWNMLMM